MRKWLPWLGSTAASVAVMLRWYGVFLALAFAMSSVLTLCWILSDDARSRRLRLLVRELRRKR